MFLRIRKRDLGLKICAHFSLLGLGKVTGHPKVNVFYINSLKNLLKDLIRIQATSSTTQTNKLK